MLYPSLKGEKKVNKIKEVIWDSGYRKNYIAEKMGIQSSSISMWISGVRVPNKARIRQLCKLLSCKVKDIFPEGIPNEPKR